MKILIAYATLSGNTQTVAESIGKHLAESPHEATVVSQEDIETSLFAAHDLVILGASTWGEGEGNPTAESFLQKMKDHAEPFLNTKFAVFGLGDSSYPNFCGVVAEFEEAIKAKQGNLISESLKIDGYPDDTAFANANAWADKVIASCGT